ncbi:glycosyltransferase [Patescibacteria group bacterium]|nr:glycosyltransferase [Patescibacteria group bacterium]MBU0846469.1 glycosyltransferase [Patescibacteria group bacterium]
MKLLYLSHPETDYGAEHLWFGLCQQLGSENVVDFPYHYTFHGKAEQLQNPEVRNYLANHRESPLAKGGYSAPLHWMPSSKGAEYSYEDIKKLIKSGEFDIILLPSPREINLHFADRLKHDNCLNAENLVFTDFEDSSFIRYDIIDYFKPVCSFKSNLVSKTDDIHPLPMASPIVDNLKYALISSEPKKVDLYARLGHTTMDRRIFLDLIKGISNIFVSSDHTHYVNYLEEIAKSKIAICMRGFGHITVRHFEIPSFKTLMFMENLQARIPYPFEDGKTCVIFDPYDLRDFISKVEYYLINESERQRIAEAGYELVKKYHTCKARAQQFIDTIEKCH